MNNSILTIVVPCYNEQEVLPETVKELVSFRMKQGRISRLLESIFLKSTMRRIRKLSIIRSMDKKEMYWILRKRTEQQ